MEEFEAISKQFELRDFQNKNFVSNNNIYTIDYIEIYKESNNWSVRFKVKHYDWYIDYKDFNFHII